MRTTFKKISSLALFVIFFSCLQNCDFSIDKDDNNFVDCVGKLNVDFFHFKGTHRTNSIEYYENKYDRIESFGDIASVAFNANKTFLINVKFKCDTVSSVPLCDSINFVSGFKELNIEGSWDFDQYIETFSGYRQQSNRIEGQCYLSVDESTNDMLNGEKLICDIHIGCGISTIDYVMDINIPLIDEDRLMIQIYK